MYRIAVTGSGTLTVWSTDVYGYLLSSSGSKLASNDDGGQGRNFQIGHSASAGTYYVRVKHYSTTGTGDYGITSNFYASSSSSSVSYEATLSTGSSRSGSISPAGDQDVYRITISRTGTLTFYSTGSTDTYRELRAVRAVC